MGIAVFGAGYVGLVSAVCFAKLGHQTLCADIDIKRIELLQKGECPIYENGLEDLLQEQLASGTLTFTSHLIEAVKTSRIFIIATGTPSLADGSADLSQVFAVANLIAEHAQDNSMLVIKSTVPLGTGDIVEALVKKKVAHKTIKIAVASNPEFLREGCAIDDFLNADRIVVGGDSASIPQLKALYQPLIDKGIPFLTMSRTSAELTKYSANAMLACRISFMNQISQLAEACGANIDDIKQGMALDPRIGPFFLNAGIGYGGSCFPKDVRALVQLAKTVDVDTFFLEAIDHINELQKDWLFKQLSRYFKHDLRGKKIGFWGLAFKPGTDDLREASSLVAIHSLLEAGSKIIAFDPAAISAAQQRLQFKDELIWCQTQDEVFDFHLDALVIATEWPEFVNYPLSALSNKLDRAPLFDGRNCFKLDAVRQAGLTYISVGRPFISNELMELIDYAH